ncbi:MAG: DUF3616 domain-containing protein [Granulosicoccus sp.]
MQSHSVALYSTLLGVLLTLTQVLAEPVEHAEKIGEPVARGVFAYLREPSGVIALDAQTLMVIEDEASRALWRLRLNAGDSPASAGFHESSQPAAKGFIQRQLLAPLDDLEGIARLSANRFFIIGSHENASRGKHPSREKLVLLTRSGDDIISASMRRDLFDQLISQYPQLAKTVAGSKKGKRRALNIEALAFDRKREQLLIGLRTPLSKSDDHAIVISLANATDYLAGEQPEFSDSMHFVDLDGDGIRAMAYDDLSDQILIVSKPESGGKNRSTLWTLAATMNMKPVRYKSYDKNLFKDVEGLAPVNDDVLFVRDNGGKTKKGDDQWFILERSQLRLDYP